MTLESRHVDNFTISYSSCSDGSIDVNFLMGRIPEPFDLKINSNNFLEWNDSILFYNMQDFIYALDNIDTISYASDLLIDGKTDPDILFIFNYDEPAVWFSFDKVKFKDKALVFLLSGGE